MAVVHSSSTDKKSKLARLRNLNYNWLICSHQQFWYSRVFQQNFFCHSYCLFFCRKANKAWGFCCRGGLKWTENHKKQRNCWGSHRKGTLHVWCYSVSVVFVLAAIQQVTHHLSMAWLGFLYQWCNSLSFVCAFGCRRSFSEISVICITVVQPELFL